jgi:hypothetical protein
MEKLLLGILATIAGVLAMVLFGKPKGPEPTQADAPIEQIELPPQRSEPVIVEPVIVEPVIVESAISEPQSSQLAISEPTVGEPTVSEPTLNNQPFTDSRTSQTPTQTISTPVTALPANTPEFDPKSDAEAVRAARTGERSGNAISIEPLAARTQSSDTVIRSNATSVLARSMPPFAAIQDPNRPRTPELQDLSQEIINLGRSQKRSNLSLLLQYRTHDDAMIRRYVAYAMGQLVGAGSASDKQAVIPFLQELTQDTDRNVQQMAANVLKQVRR